MAYRDKYPDPLERERVRTSLIAWENARRWWGKIAVASRVDKEMSKPYFTTNEIVAIVMLWAKEHERWPNDSNWGREFPNLNWRAMNRFDGVTGFQRYVLRKYSDAWVQENLSATLVLTVNNLTLRRIAFEKYGMEKVILGGGGHLIHDDDYGKLWQLPPDNTRDQRTLYVEVENKTPNEQGEYDHYFLRVPPNMVSARQAVRWTFGMTTDTMKVGNQIHQPGTPVFAAES